MKYNVSQVPNTQHARNFKVKSADNKHAMVFSLSKDLISVWGNPSEACLKEFMVAYVKKHGWSKAEVMICEKEASRSLAKSIQDLGGKKAPAKKKAAK